MGNIRRNQFGVVFALLGVWLGWRGLRHLDSWLGFLALSGAVAFAALGATYLLGMPGLLGKTRTGRLLASSYLLFWPYHLFSYGSLLWFRLSRVAPFQEIIPGLYLGGRLFFWERGKIQAEQFAGVLDLTCEFSEVGFLRRGPAYLCLPLLDGSAPSRPMLAAGIEFIRERLVRGPVYVHCAMGHGRGATFVAAYLLAAGKAATVEEAVQIVRSKRPGVRLRTEQTLAIKCLEHERRDL